MGGDTSAVLGAIQNDSITFGNGEVDLNGTAGKAKVTFTGHTSDSGSTTVNFYDASDNKQAVGFTNRAGGTINVSTSSDNYILVGNHNDKKDGGSTLTGGKGNDTILAGAGDVVNAGAGKENLVVLQSNSVRGGAEVIVAAGSTSIQNANSGFDETGDVINVDLSKVTLSVEDSDLVLGANGVHATVIGVGSDGVAKQLLKSDGVTFKAAIAASGNEIAVTDNDDIANYYQGETVNFTAYGDSVKADLYSGDSSIDGGIAAFNGVKTFYAGAGNTTFMGGAANETLYAGTGYASLYGGGGRNVLSNNTSADKSGVTSFFVLGAVDGARDTISNFEFLATGGDNSATADKIEIDTASGNVVSNVYIRDGGVAIDVTKTSGTTETALIQGAVGQNMRFGDNVVAQANTNSLIYDGTANYFVATEQNAAISVAADIGAKAEIWLDGKPNNGLGKNFVGDIRTVDASYSSVKAELAGSGTINNTILAGSGDTSLWGGNGGDDFMQGGAGHDSFFYTNGNGNDTISGSSAGDVVFLSEMTLEQLSTTAVSNGTAVISFKDGGSLTIGDAANCQFVLTQGDQYQVYKVSGDQFVAG